MREKWTNIDDMIGIGMLTSSLPAFSRKYQSAVDLCMKEMEATPGAIMVSVSGGKDSVSMLPIIDEAAKDAGKDYFVWAHVSNASFPGTIETIKAAAQKYNRPCIIDHSPVDAFSVVGKGSSQQFGKKGYFANAISHAYKAHSVTLSFVGVRAGESNRRRTAIQVHGRAFNTSVYGGSVRVVYPVAYMDVNDIMAVIATHELPLHPIYFKKAMGSLPIRLGYVTATDLLHKDVSLFLHYNYPDLYQKLAAVYPEVRLYG